MAQLGSALDWGSSGRRFKSCQPDQMISEGGFPETGNRLFCVSGPAHSGVSDTVRDSIRDDDRIADLGVVVEPPCVLGAEIDAAVADVLDALRVHRPWCGMHEDPAPRDAGGVLDVEAVASSSSIGTPYVDESMIMSRNCSMTGNVPSGVSYPGLPIDAGMVCTT